MSNKTEVKPKTAPAVEEEKPAVHADVKQEQKYLVEKLRQHSVELFGVTTSTFDGALYGHSNPEYSIEEVKKIIDAFLNGGK